MTLEVEGAKGSKGRVKGGMVGDRDGFKVGYVFGGGGGGGIRIFK